MLTSPDFGSAHCFDQAFDRLFEQVTALGFDGVDYAYLPRPRSAAGTWAAPDIRARNFPHTWRRGWSRYAAHDPYFRSSWHGNLPVDWDLVKSAPWLTPLQHQSIAYIEEHMGFVDGLTVPIHLAGGRFAFVSVTNRARGDWRRSDGAIGERVFVLAHAFQAGIAGWHPACRSSYAAATLTTREIECLGAAARGLSAPATARCMHRSVETVRFHLKSAMRKLAAHTITQAVARAIAAGVLESGSQDER